MTRKQKKLRRALDDLKRWRCRAGEYWRGQYPNPYFAELPKYAERALDVCEALLSEMSEGAST